MHYNIFIGCLASVILAREISWRDVLYILVAWCALVATGVCGRINMKTYAVVIHVMCYVVGLRALCFPSAIASTEACPGGAEVPPAGARSSYVEIVRQ